MIDPKIIALSERLRRYTSDEDVISRFRVDISDLLEICAWFTSRMDNIEPQVLTDEQLDEVLADLDTRLIWHARFHLDSLSKDIELLTAEDGET